MPDATAQQVNTFVAQPINNLIVFLAILALVIVVCVIFLAWKFGPALINLYRQQADTNKQNAETAAKLTQIVQQNATQYQLAVQSVDNNTTEMSKQTSAIEAQTEIIAGQGRDFRSYQTLVSDNMSAHTSQLAENTEALNKVDTRLGVVENTVNELKTEISELRQQIDSLIDDKLKCADVDGKLERILKRLDEFKPAPPVNAVAVVLPNANTLPDTGDASALPKAS